MLCPHRSAHDLCKFNFDSCCCICLTRSLVLRLKNRGSGPKTLVPLEAFYLLKEMDRNGFDWRTSTDMRRFMAEFMKLYTNQNILPFPKTIKLKCNVCHTSTSVVNTNLIHLRPDVNSRVSIEELVYGPKIVRKKVFFK